MVWAKGQPGNPGGRPVVNKEVRELALDMCPEGMKRLGEIMRDKSQPGSARVAAIREIFDRAMGKPEQQHRVSGQINFVQLLAEYTQLRALEEAGEVELKGDYGLSRRFL